MADETGGGAEVPESADEETPAEHLMEHNADLEPTDDEARDEEAAELIHEHEANAPDADDGSPTDEKA